MILNNFLLRNLVTITFSGLWVYNTIKFTKDHFPIFSVFYANFNLPILALSFFVWFVFFFETLLVNQLVHWETLPRWDQLVALLDTRVPPSVPTLFDYKVSSARDQLFSRWLFITFWKNFKILIIKSRGNFHQCIFFRQLYFLRTVSVPYNHPCTL